MVRLVDRRALRARPRVPTSDREMPGLVFSMDRRPFGSQSLVQIGGITKLWRAPAGGLEGKLQAGLEQMRT